METQKTLNSQSYAKQKEQAEDIITLDLNLYYRAMITKIALY
jgi:hypothetical protein